MADFKFKFDSDVYTAQGAKTTFREHEREMKEEYSRMRSAAQKRIQRMKESEFKNSKTLKEHENGFKKIDEIDPRDFHKAFKEVADFLKSKRGSASGLREIRRKTIESLNKAIGGKKVNTKNYDRVIKVLEEMRRRKITYGSDTVVDKVEMTMELSDTQFDKLLDNVEQFIQMDEGFMGSLETYMVSIGVESFQQVDMGSFLAQIGW